MPQCGLLFSTVRLFAFMWLLKGYKPLNSCLKLYGLFSFCSVFFL